MFECSEQKKAYEPVFRNSVPFTTTLPPRDVRSDRKSGWPSGPLSVATTSWSTASTFVSFTGSPWSGDTVVV
jgi:hypothetical protein